MKRARMLVVVGLLASACEAHPSARPSPTPLDKQSTFGSASLVPTREGERARRELAIAGELEQALAQLELGPAHVIVELREPVTVIVIARQREGHDASEAKAAAEAEVIELAHAMIPALAPANLHVWLQPASVVHGSPTDPHSRTWLLMLACIGLGLSLGIVRERLRVQ